MCPSRSQRGDVFPANREEQEEREMREASFLQVLLTLGEWKGDSKLQRLCEACGGGCAAADRR